jgi:Xaa-Pro aminopeptidase
VGDPSDRQRRIYDTMVRAHGRGVEGTKPGLTGAEWYEMMQKRLPR